MITNVSEIYSFNDLYDSSWSGAVDTLKTIMENNKEDEFLQYANELLSTYDNGLDITKLNDWLWFDRDYIYESLGIDNE